MHICPNLFLDPAYPSVSFFKVSLISRLMRRNDGKEKGCEEELARIEICG